MLFYTDAFTTISASTARMARVIDQQRRYVILPWQMAVVGRVLRLLPAVVWDGLTRNMKRKPRTVDTA